MSCARGKISIRHDVLGHYELRIVETSEPRHDAELCLTKDELLEVREMISEMFPSPDLVERDFTSKLPRALRCEYRGKNGRCIRDDDHDGDHHVRMEEVT